MDVNAISQFIGSYGFPIVACGALFWYIVKEQRESRKTQDELKSVIQSNTEMIKQLCELVREVIKRG